jgi:hypothetical protein
MNLRGLNGGELVAWAGVLFSLGSAVGYAIAKDVRHALYFTFAAAITVCVIWR